MAANDQISNLSKAMFAGLSKATQSIHFNDKFDCKWQLIAENRPPREPTNAYTYQLYVMSKIENKIDE